MTYVALNLKSMCQVSPFVSIDSFPMKSRGGKDEGQTDQAKLDAFTVYISYQMAPNSVPLFVYYAIIDCELSKLS